MSEHIFMNQLQKQSLKVLKAHVTAL